MNIGIGTIMGSFGQHIPALPFYATEIELFGDPPPKMHRQKSKTGYDTDTCVCISEIYYVYPIYTCVYQKYSLTVFIMYIINRLAEATPMAYH